VIRQRVIFEMDETRCSRPSFSGISDWPISRTLIGLGAKSRLQPRPNLCPVNVLHDPLIRPAPNST
jgi:hypothetical protein